MSRLSFTGAMLLFALLLTACASPPSLRVDYDRSADISAYRPFGFPEPTGTDRGGYSTLITGYFKKAVREQMTQRGYVYTEDNPELLVNFFTNLRERTEVRPTVTLGYGYYGYRWGVYQAWPLYPHDLDTVTYPFGTMNIDVVDAAKKQLIWEGVAEGRVREADMKNPGASISGAVAMVMRGFPQHRAM